MCLSNILCVNSRDNRKRWYVNFFCCFFSSVYPPRRKLLFQYLILVCCFKMEQKHPRGQINVTTCLFLFIRLKDIIDRFIVESTNYVELITKSLRLRTLHSSCWIDVRTAVKVNELWRYLHVYKIEDFCSSRVFAMRKVHGRVRKRLQNEKITFF